MLQLLLFMLVHIYPSIQFYEVAEVLELKVPSGKDSLRSLSAQIEEYMEEFPLLAVVIADKSDLVSDKDDSQFYDPDLEKGLTKKIIEYADKYKVKYGIKTLIFSVKKRKKKK